MGKMEFGIVRNNIYRLAINSFSQVGSTSPKPDDVTLIDEQLQLTIQVQPWEVRTHQEVDM